MSALWTFVWIATGIALGCSIVVALEWLDRRVGPWWSTAVVAVTVAAGVVSLAVFG